MIDRVKNENGNKMNKTNVKKIICKNDNRITDKLKG